MVPDLKIRRLTTALALAGLLAACGSGNAARMAGPEFGHPSPAGIPNVAGPEFDAGGGTTTLGGEQLASVKEAAPPGLHITRIEIATLSKRARDALRFTGFRSGTGPGLLTLPVYGINPDLGMYYLIVPVINEGSEPVRNLKARADFFDDDGVLVWTETQPVTHFPTRLGLNPPSLPKDPEAPPGELGLETTGFQLFYFNGNVGLFTFAVPDTAVAKTVASWELTFLVSTT